MTRVQDERCPIIARLSTKYLTLKRVLDLIERKAGDMAPILSH